MLVCVPDLRFSDFLAPPFFFILPSFCFLLPSSIEICICLFANFTDLINEHGSER